MTVTGRGKPLLIAFLFVLDTTRRFPFVLNATGRGKPLLIVFLFILDTTRRGKPLFVAFPLFWTL